MAYRVGDRVKLNIKYYQLSRGTRGAVTRVLRSRKYDVSFDTGPRGGVIDPPVSRTIRENRLDPA